MQIGEIAQRANVSVKTIRYYEEVGILEEPHRLASGYRDYELGVVDRIRFVRASQASGLSLGEIRQIIAFRDRGEAPCAHVLELLQHRDGEIEQQIAELKSAQEAIRRLVARARKLKPKDCAPSSICHIIVPPGHRGV